jgi:hypothetical protein
VTTALKALDRRSTPSSVVSGRSNRLTAASVRMVPRRLALAISGRAMGA